MLALPPGRTIPADVPGPHELTAAQRAPRRLKPSDRCDGCGAQAYAAAELYGVDLLFCAHHFARHELPIRRQAEEVLDERWALILERTPA